MYKLIVLFVSLIFSVPLWAIDIVKLNNGHILEGEIYQKDNDGSVYIRLVDGNTRYVMSDEISSIESDNRKFEFISNEISSKNRKYKFFIYSDYELTMPSKYSFEDAKIKFQNNSSGLCLGFGASLPIKYGISFDPSLEFALEFFNRNKNIDFSGNRNINDKYDDYYIGTEDLYLFARIPLAISYCVFSNTSVKLSIFTGPVIESIITRGENGDFWEQRLVDSIYHRDSGEYGGIDWECNLKYNRIAFDWRIGVKIFIKNVFCSASYSIGLNNRIRKAYLDSYAFDYFDNYDSSNIGIKVKSRRDMLKIGLGIQF